MPFERCSLSYLETDPSMFLCRSLFMYPMASGLTLPSLMRQMNPLLDPMHSLIELWLPSFLTVPVLRSRIRPPLPPPPPADESWVESCSRTFSESSG